VPPSGRDVEKRLKLCSLHVPASAGGWKYRFSKLVGFLAKEDKRC